MLWEVDIYPAPDQRDLAAARIAADAADLGLSPTLRVASARGYLLQGPLDAALVRRAARSLLSDAVVEHAVVGAVGDAVLAQPPAELAPPGELAVRHVDCADSTATMRRGSPAAAPGQAAQAPGSADGWRLVHVLLKPGVMDPVALSAQQALQDAGVPVEAVRTFDKYWIRGLNDAELQLLARKALANDCIQQVHVGPLAMSQLDVGTAYEFRLVRIALRDMDDEALCRLSRQGQLSLSLDEMRTVQEHFRRLGRDPTDAELETIAQTWSEHCSHKTLRGRIRYRDPEGERQFENMLRETIFAATQQIRASLGDDDWCVSVFEDNAGVVRFDERFHVVFKVETHNHPSALEPYGGANTGLGGVIRDPLGTGLGAKPIANTDVFCFAPPDLSLQELPPGVLHPRRVVKGVVAGVRDYGNRMGIPTVNGAVYFDRRYLGNPLVFCGNVGLLPCDKAHKQPQAGDRIVLIGGRTGRDGIHGATFSSVQLSDESETVSSGAVQIGNAITEKMLLDVVLQARDQGLFHALTDCGAGGLSSAVGEMGEHLGARVELDRVPLKYEGLSYTEIWISEAQERMVLAVPPENWESFAALCAAEGVEATCIGEFVPTGRLELFYAQQQVADLDMHFLHRGRPAVVREAHYAPPAASPLCLPDKYTWDYTPELRAILQSLNVASKEWIIRQYDHEVQGGSVVKPLVGVGEDGPSDAAVLRPVLGSRRGIVIACGMNPRYGDLDPYHMAASGIDEAVRNCVAVGADPRRIAILDNFCWGNTDRAEQLGSLVRAALGCHDVAVALGTPFISGKDSLNNEFHYRDADGRQQHLVIPPTLLISALGQIDDVDRAVTMDLKQPGNFLYQVGVTRNELGGSHLALVLGLTGGDVPRVDPHAARDLFMALHQAMRMGLVRACHDLSEGGLAVAAAEMALAGGCGARIFLAQVPHELPCDDDAQRQLDQWRAAYPEVDLHPLAAHPDAAAVLLFSESNTRFLCEVPPEHAEAFEQALRAVPHALVGEVTDSGRLEIVGIPRPYQEEPTDPPEVTAPLVVSAPIAELKELWQAPLRW
jgi:phosphoribosylformylglycinamidine synthase II